MRAISRGRDAMDRFGSAQRALCATSSAPPNDLVTAPGMRSATPKVGTEHDLVRDHQPNLDASLAAQCGLAFGVAHDTSHGCGGCDHNPCAGVPTCGSCGVEDHAPPGRNKVLGEYVGDSPTPVQISGGHLPACALAILRGC